MIESELDDLFDQADAAADAGEAWTAALLYERAHQLAAEYGYQEDALYALQRGATCWRLTSEFDRGLTLLLEAMHQPRFHGDEEHRYWLQNLFVTQALDYGVHVTSIDDQIELLSSLAVAVWGAEGSNTLYRRSQLLSDRGHWQAALDVLEQAWVHRADAGPTGRLSAITYQASAVCLHLARRKDAERWMTQLDASEDQFDDHWSRAKHRADLAFFDNDARSARSACRQIDALVPSQQADLPMYATLYAVHALLLDPAEGDPASAAHLARVRMNNDASALASMPWELYNWHHSVACLELASVRYGAGMLPVDDVFYQRTQVLPPPEEARLPADIARRLATFERACATALKHARTEDSHYGSSRHEEEVARIHQRGTAIGAVFRRP
ncbi:hypothetical protein OG787_34510 [Streptomyces sp. NBC_00075]|uniref:hypothetical protein n=1 Tax=Streptomyces sp. NBC_00075 TaxID=2975641 RepID=UPI00324F553D